MSGKYKHSGKSYESPRFSEIDLYLIACNSTKTSKILSGKPNEHFDRKFIEYAEYRTLGGDADKEVKKMIGAWGGPQVDFSYLDLDAMREAAVDSSVFTSNKLYNDVNLTMAHYKELMEEKEDPKDPDPFGRPPAPTAEVKISKFGSKLSAAIRALLAVEDDDYEHDPDLAEAIEYDGYKFETLANALIDNVPDPDERLKHIRLLILWIALRGPSTKNIKTVKDKSVKADIDKAVSALKVKERAESDSKTVTLGRLAGIFVLTLLKTRKGLVDEGKEVSNPKPIEDPILPKWCQFTGFALVIPESKDEVFDKLLEWSKGITTVVSSKELKGISDSEEKKARIKELKAQAEKYLRIIKDNSIYSETEKEKIWAMMETQKLI